MPTLDEVDDLALYYWPTPNGYKVAIMLEELGLAYQVLPINITKGDQHADGYVQQVPTRKIPALRHQRRGAEQIVFESGAILLYLAEWQGRFLPEDVGLKWQCLQWLFWQVGGLGPMAGQAHHFRLYADLKDDYAIDRYERACQKLYAVLEGQLQQKPFLAGAYSIADIAVLPWVYRHVRHGIDLVDYPAVLSWYTGLMQRPAVRKGFSVGQDLIAKGNFSGALAKRSLF
ncbi:MAG: glutathione S-transferase family protein [Pseudomonadales bacterium]|tara:strand:+ start:867 stop:1556 length:690 start_codon:yes stop_codon:yes gene_type:complete